jgi:hypothetical protein
MRAAVIGCTAISRGPHFFLVPWSSEYWRTGLLALGPYARNNIVGLTLIVALLSFVPEIWKKYV